MILDRLLAPSSLPLVRAGTPAPDDDYWYSEVSTVARSGANVTPDSAMRVSAVLACVRVLAETIGSLPWILYRRNSDGGKERAVDHPLYEKLHDQPNEWQTSFDFLEMMIGHCALRGNAFAEIVADSRGRIDQLIPLHPDRMTVYRLKDHRLRYEFRQEDTGTPVSYRQDQIFHLRWMSSDGVTGMSPIELSRESIGLALATEAHGARVFKNKAVPGAVVIHPGALKKEARDNLKRGIQEQYTQENIHKTLILEEGMTWQQMGMTNEDAQYLETRKFQIRDIARIFRIQPHMIEDLEDATYNNIEHQGLEFVTQTLRPWLVRIERAVRRDLLTDVERKTFFAEFLVDGLLRGDIKTRYEAYGIGIVNGFLTRNEARILENRNPLEGLDEILVPLNMGKATGKEEEPEAHIEIVHDYQAADILNTSMRASVHTDDNEDVIKTEILVPIIEDVAERIANAEFRELEKRMNKANEDRKRFNKWVEKFYGEHREYVCRTLAPLSRSWAARTGEMPDFADVIEIAVDSPKEALQTVEDVVKCITSWRTERPGQIVKALKKELENE